MQRALDRRGIAAMGNIKNRQLVTRTCIDPRHQRDVTLDAGHQFGVAGLLQPQLVQGANAVGVAVEDVVEFHE